MIFPCLYLMRSPYFYEVKSSTKIPCQLHNLVLDVHPKNCCSRFFIGILGMPDFWTSSKIIWSWCNIMIYIYIYIWVNYNDLTATSLESWLVRNIIPKYIYIYISHRLVKKKASWRVELQKYQGLRANLHHISFGLATWKVASRSQHRGCIPFHPSGWWHFHEPLDTSEFLDHPVSNLHVSWLYPHSFRVDSGLFKSIIVWI